MAGVQCGYGGTVSPVRKAVAVRQTATTGVTRSWAIVLPRLHARLYAVMLVTSVADRSEVHRFSAALWAMSRPVNMVGKALARLSTVAIALRS